MRARHEAGATAVIVAATLLVLMGMAAIAIDLGAGFSERRLDQTGADISAVSGALDLALGVDTQDVVDEIVLLVDTNVRPTDLARWTSCIDPGRLIASDPFPVTAADLGLTPATDCISFDTFARIRVRVPDQNTDTSFGGVLGAQLLRTSAPAEAASELPGGGTPPPFVVLSDYSGGQTLCLRTGPSPTEPPPVLEGNEPNNPAARGTTPDPCDESVYSSDSEMLGLLDPVTYFNADGTINCGPTSNDYFIAAGIDHPLSSYLQKYPAGYSPGDPEIQDGDGCTGSPKSPVNGPDTMRLKTGLTAQELRCGMLSTRNGTCATVVPGPPSSGLSSPPRLQQGVLSANTFLGESMDNRPLWAFFVKDASGDVSFAAGAPASCTAFGNQINAGFSPATWDYYDKRDDLLDCLNDWNPGGVQLFEDAIWSSPRFAFLPFLAEDTLDSSDASAILAPSACPVTGGECVHVDDFVPVWIQTLYTRSPSAACDDFVSSGPDQWGLHHAGQPNDCGNTNGNLDRLAAIVLDCGMISQDACDARPGPPSTPGGDLVPTVRLTR